MPLITFGLSLSDVRRTRSMGNKALGVRSASSMSTGQFSKLTLEANSLQN